MQHLYLENGEINPKLYDCDVIIYGCGNDGQKLYLKLKKANMKVRYFCDSNVELHGSKIYDVPVISWKELSEHSDCNIALAFFRWPEVLERIPDVMKGKVFADFLYEHQTDKKCILCGSKETTFDNAHFSPFLIERMFCGKEQKTALVHCKNCDLFFSEYRPSPEENNRLYSSYRSEEYLQQRKKYEKGYTLAYNSSFQEQTYISARKKALVEFLKEHMDFKSVKNLLDYGGDEGQFIPDEFEKAKKYVYEVSGNQVVEDVMLLTDLTEVNEMQWDFIMCCHVLEHLSNPLEVVENLINITKNGAYLYLELPREERIKCYSDVEINEHINFYSENVLKKIGDIFGVEIVAVRTEDTVIRALYKNC